ncbi:hypothetical protein [Streptomyces sp. NPDC053755]|uniref:hypothetical protein n=1 Tax=Streptomyces sp. NPDC053755 TaxID=3155815 RepID=UPI003445770E
MNLRAQAGMGILMTALASAAMAAPATAAEAPVIVPLQGLEPVIPMDAPTVASGVPMPVPGAPTGFQHGRAAALPDVGLPQVPLGTTVPETLVAAPLPEVLDGSRPGTAQVANPRARMATATPGATLGNPLTQPRGEHAGLPALAEPQLGVIGPAARGTLGPELGLAQPTA